MPQKWVEKKFGTMRPSDIEETTLDAAKRILVLRSHVKCASHFTVLSPSFLIY